MSNPHDGAGPADALVLFGATGDLAHKMIFPALYAMVKRGALDVPVIGVAYSKWDLQHLRARVRDSIAQRRRRHRRPAGPRPADRAAWRTSTATTTTPARSRRSSGRSAHAKRPAHYLAIPPSLFATVIEGLGARGLADGGARHRREAVRARPRLRERSSTAWRDRCSLRTRSSASTTSSARRRS